LPLSNRTLWCLAGLLLSAQPVFAQDAPPAAVELDGGGAVRWEPLGLLPVDQAGAGLRGYALAGDDASVSRPGTQRIGFHVVAANNFYEEQTSNLLISQRYETHTLALEYRRGFRLQGFPRFELGAQVQLTQQTNGFLNGFIATFEDLAAAVSWKESAKDRMPRSREVLPPFGTFITKDGRELYGRGSGGSGFGDFSIGAKALLRDAPPSSSQARVAARVALNIAGTPEFTKGNFAGAGVSLDKKLLPSLAFHGDLRANVFLDNVSQWGLPLKRGSLGFSAGTELKLTTNSSASLQIDGNTTPYLRTGTKGLDLGQGDITLGVGRRFSAGRNGVVVVQGYLRENMSFPFRVRWNTDPDLALGIKITVQAK
jgi:hypothetical protein